MAEQSLQNSCFGCIIDCCEAHGNSNKGSKAWISFLLWPKCSNSCLENGKNVEDFFNIIWFLFNAAYLCFSLVLLVSKAHSFFVPALSVAQQKLLRMGTAPCGAECSARGTSTSCNDLKEGAEWVPAQGWPAWGSGVRGEEMYPSDLNVWLWAQHPWLARDPAFQGDTQRIVTICPLEMTFHTPAHSKDTGRFHSWLRGQGCWPLLSSTVCNQ